ncbi:MULTISPECIES: helix-turn-helix domain-containing protein [Acidaminococcus]|uniref:helix-turn-helix domain-containing protein n=1 Tax=Acidaminococcus TaxID=904 RepID=UPI0005EBA59B|nr:MULTISPECIES: helix-turn-helix transcriptional regulator [Acidaminococcus]MDY2739987.1 helix-turn-helix transcriptional regulator [Acidaminococcus sp.]
MEFQISLKAARVNAKMTLIQGAKAIGIGKDTLIKWERNPGLVNPIYQEKISKAYNLPVNCINFSPCN